MHDIYKRRSIFKIQNLKPEVHQFDAVYNTGEVVRISLHSYLEDKKDKAWMGKLYDPAFFAQVTLRNGVPTWPNEVDFCPDALFEQHPVISSGKAIAA